MGFPGTWVTPSNSVVYRVIPKCACSTIGQILYYTDHGSFFDGDIHDAKTGMMKWNQEESRDAISSAVLNPDILTFTCVRNPYTRVLSSFFDKICGIQRNGKRYRGNFAIVTVENFQEDMKGVLSRIDIAHPIDIETMPRFNESEGHGPKRAHPVADYFDDLSMHLVQEIYARDFVAFNYDLFDPSRSAPLAEIDLDKVHAMLGG